MDVYRDLQDLVAQVPDLLQPLVVAVAGAVPYIEGEGSAVLGVIAGLHPVVAAVAGAAGNIISVVAVVLLGSRVRAAVTARRSRAAVVPAMAGGAEAPAAPEGPVEPVGREEQESKGRKRLRRFVVRFGVPGASLLGPVALPTQLTAATLVASGVRKSWVLLWQVLAILLWTGLVTLAATGVLSAVTG